MRGISIALLASLLFPFVKAEEDGTTNMWTFVDNEYNLRTEVPQGKELLQDQLSVLLDTGKLDLSEDENGYIHTTLALPSGEVVEFKLRKTEVLPPALQEKYPEIVSFSGESLNHEPKLYADVTHSPYQGFHAQIFDGTGYVYIDPYNKEDDEYKVYNAKAVLNREPWVCGAGHAHTQPVDENEEIHVQSEEHNEKRMLASSSNKQYRFTIAISASAQFANYHGGSIAQALAGIVVVMSRVNGIYKRELGLFFQLHPSNDDLICATDSTFDTCSLTNTDNDLDGNLDFINSRGITSSTYDLGHVFTTTSGGVAYLGVLCTSFKSGGLTGLTRPTGDAFAVDYVSHEIGHQLLGRHTFQDCGGDWSSSNVGVEPGSASTIMGYAGICGSTNLQRNSDPMFHSKNIEDMLTFIQKQASRSGCGKTITGDDAPTVAFPTSCTLPTNQYFQLAFLPSTSSDGFYTIEPVTPSTSLVSYSSREKATFRSYLPTTRRSRTFPNMFYILNGNGKTAYDEVLAKTDTDLTFRGMVRSQYSKGSLGSDGSDADGFGTVAWSDAQVSFVSRTPLEISSSTNSMSLQAGLTFSFTWTVGETASLAPKVKIAVAPKPKWSSLADLTELDWVEIAHTENDGAEEVSIPVLPGGDAVTSILMMVRSEDDSCYFFDVVTVSSFINQMFSESPTAAPTTKTPTAAPTTAQPTDAPTTLAPTTANPTGAPTNEPTLAPTTPSPTKVPTLAPSRSPTTPSPTLAPVTYPEWYNNYEKVCRSRKTKSKCNQYANKYFCVWYGRYCATSISSPPTMSPTTAAPTSFPTKFPTGSPTTYQQGFDDENEYCGAIPNKSVCNKQRDLKRKQRCKWTSSCISTRAPPPTPRPTHAPTSFEAFDLKCKSIRSRTICRRTGCKYTSSQKCFAPDNSN